MANSAPRSPISTIAAPYADSRANQFHDAPEVDPASFAPEGVPHDGPQVNYDSSILHDTNDPSREKQTTLFDAKQKTSRKSHCCGLPRRLWISVVVLLALGLGIGLGVGLGKSKSQGTSISSPDIPIPPSLIHGVCNDSSFAAVTTPDGTKHVFFQDTNGTLRQAQISTTTQTWATSLNFIIPDTTDARQNTPMAVITLTENFDSATPILLLYISQHNTLAASMFNYQNGQNWANASGFFNVSQYATAPGSRSLALSQVPASNSSSQLSLWFVNPDGGITGLLGNHPPVLPQFRPTLSDPFWSWANITTTLEAKMPSPSPIISEPFLVFPDRFFVNVTTTTTSFQGLYAMYFIPNAAPQASILYARYINDTWSAGTAGFESLSNATTGAVPDVPGTPPVDNNAVSASDWVHARTGTVAQFDSISDFRLWVNGSTLSYIGAIGQTPKPVQTPPTSPFPYARLAVISVENSTAFYLFHQINESAIAEDVWDSSIEGWTSSMISIATA